MNYSHKNLLTVANDHEDQTNSRSDYFDCNVCFQSFELEFELAIHKKKHNGTRNALNLDTDDYVNDLIEFEDNVIKAETESDREYKVEPSKPDEEVGNLIVPFLKKIKKRTKKDLILKNYLVRLVRLVRFFMLP